jgi:hypothetical protein
LPSDRRIDTKNNTTQEIIIVHHAYNSATSSFLLFFCTTPDVLHKVKTKYQKKKTERPQKPGIEGKLKLLGPLRGTQLFLSGLIFMHVASPRLDFLIFGPPQSFRSLTLPHCQSFESNSCLFSFFITLLTFFTTISPYSCLSFPSCNSQSCMTLRNGRAAEPTFFNR